MLDSRRRTVRMDTPSWSSLIGRSTPPIEACPARWADTNANTSARLHVSWFLANHGEKHLQVVGRGQHRVRPAPPGQKPQILVHQRHTQPHRLTRSGMRTDQAHVEQSHRG
jgi:hypothetical protein